MEEFKRVTKEDKLKSLMDELGAKPYVKKQDGMAVKVDEDKEIEYEDYEGNKNVLKVPKGSYVVTEGNNCYPEIRQAEDFEAKNEFIKESKKKKESGLGITILTGE